jgi:purine-binding chemotaxis protein CheW
LSTNTARIPVLLVRVGGRIAALPLEYVVETMRPLATEPLAGAASFVLGIAVIRGVPTPVVDLRRLLGGADAGPIGRYVSARLGEHHAAFAVDEVLGMRELDAATLKRLPPLMRDASVDAVAAVATVDQELLSLLQASRQLVAEIDQATRRHEVGG